MERFTDLETVVQKAPFHLSKVIKEDFTRAQKNVELVRYELRHTLSRGNPCIAIIGYDVKGQSYTMVYPAQPSMRSLIDERG